MAEVANAYVSLIPSAKGFGRKLDSDIGPQLDKSGKKAGSIFAGGFKSILAPALGVLGAAAIGGFVKDTIGAASDLSESTSKVGVVFGKQASQIEAASKRSAKAMGLSQQAYLESAGTLGNLLVSLGIAPKKAAGLSTQMVKLAGDLASFNNASPEEALDALRSGLTGETEPLKRFGVNMNDATLRTQALKLGLIKTTKDAMTPQTKALAAQALIMAQTKTAQGDFARTSGGLANQQRILSAEVEDVKAKVGTALLPVVVKFATYLSKTAIPAVSDFVTGMENGTGAGGRFAHTLGDIYADLKPIGSAIKTVVSGFSGLPGSAQKVLLLAGALLVLKSRFGESIPSAQSFNRESAVAVAKTVALRGGALAAGVGLATLASKAGGVTTELGALATVGAGIATGFAVGGPVGAAIGGAAGVLSVLRGRSAAAAAAQRSLNTAGRAVAATLNEQTGALTKNTRATAAKQLADSGAFTAADKVGVSYKTVLAAALGNTTAQDRLSAAVAKYVRAQDLNSAAGKRAAGAAGLLLSATNSTSGAIDHERTKVNQTATALGNLGGKHAKPTVNVIGVDGAITKVTSLLGLLSGLSHKKFNGKVPAGMFDPNAHAKGTNDAPGGWSIVGEKGPELLNLAKHSTVIPNNKIGSAVNGSSVSGGASAGGSDAVLASVLREFRKGFAIQSDGRGGQRLVLNGA